MTNVVIFISFLLDGLLSIYQESSLFGIIFFKTMFTVTSLSLIYLRYKKNLSDYYKNCFILGLLYDVIYTNTLFLNMLIFPLLGLIIDRLYSYFLNGTFNGVLINAIILGLYHFISYVILFLTGYLPLDINLFLKDIVSILIINTIYFMLVYTFLDRTKHHRFTFRKSRYSL